MFFPLFVLGSFQVMAIHNISANFLIMAGAFGCLASGLFTIFVGELLEILPFFVVNVLIAAINTTIAFLIPSYITYDERWSYLAMVVITIGTHGAVESIMQAVVSHKYGPVRERVVYSILRTSSGVTACALSFLMRELLENNGYEIFFHIGFYCSILALLISFFISTKRFRYSDHYNHEKDPPTLIRLEEI